MGNHQSVYERQRQEDEARGREQARLAFAASQQRAAEEAARIARIAAEQEEERKRAQERLEKLQALNEHKKTLLDYTPTKPLTTNIFRGLDVSEITELRVGVFGMTGSGKSSFIKTCEVAINDDPRKFQAVIGTGGGEGTLILEDFLYECQSFRLLDTRGWAYNDMVETEEFYRICKGELLLGNECFRNRSNTTAPIPTSTSRTITDFNAIVSCILLVVKGNDPRLLTGAYKTTFQSYREFARRAGITVITIVTHMDLFTDKSKYDEVIQQASHATGSPLDQTFPIANLIPGRDRDLDNELQAMRILGRCLANSERFIKKAKLNIKNSCDVYP